MYSVVLLMAVTTGGEAPEARGCKSSCGGCTTYVSCSSSCKAPRGCKSSRGCKASSSCCAPVYSGCYASYSAPVAYSGCYASHSAATYSGCTSGAVIGGTVIGGCTTSGTVISGCTSGAVTSNVIISSENTARIVVTVPENAVVKIDGQATSSTTTVRHFESPALTAGKVYSYTFDAEYTQDGKAMKVSKVVSFEAGKTVNLDLTQGAVAVASK